MIKGDNLPQIEEELTEEKQYFHTCGQEVKKGMTKCPACGEVLEWD